MENKFKEVDKEKFIEFLNFVATKARFENITVQETIEFFKLLSYMQQQIIPKIDSNIMEIKKVHMPPVEEPKIEPKPKRGRKASK